MPGVFSIASHWVLHYLLDVVTHEQTGCAHLSAFGVAWSSDQQRVIQDGIFASRKNSTGQQGTHFNFDRRVVAGQTALYLSVLNRLRGSHLGCQAVLFNHGQMLIGEA